MTNYIKSPNLPEKQVKKVIIDYKTSTTTINNLEKMGIEPIFTQKSEHLYGAVSGHPDMQVTQLCDNIFICEYDLYEYYKSILSDAKIIRGMRVSEKYPDDILFNCVLIGKYSIHNFKYTDEHIKKFIDENNIKAINVRQGYSKCSTAVIGENAIITSDIMIHNKAQENKIRSLYTDPSDIVLKGMSNGFIGGICGKINKNTIAVNGDIERLKCGKDFIKFCYDNETDVVMLNNDIPEDIGSIIPVSY